MRSPRPRFVVLLGLLAIACLALAYDRLSPDALPRLGATAVVTELNTGAELQARVDTGAFLCSIHCEEIATSGGEGDPQLGVGETIRFRIRDNSGRSHWITTKLADVSAIRTTSQTSERPCVSLPIRVQGVNVKVLVTLNDRRSMRYPFLIGRNLLRGRFVVDVRQNSDDVPMSE